MTVISSDWPPLLNFFLFFHSSDSEGTFDTPEESPGVEKQLGQLENSNHTGEMAAYFVEMAVSTGFLKIATIPRFNWKELFSPLLTGGHLLLLPVIY